MTTGEKRSASAAQASTARPCDSCLCKRARWYCAADDAFLCQACDASVHSANQLARRHERVSLRTPGGTRQIRSEPIPSWSHGFRRKARTPRQNKPRPAAGPSAGQIPLLVPDLSSSDEPSPADDEHLLHRVPVYDPEATSSDPVTNVGSRPSAVADSVTEFSAGDADLDSLLRNDLDSASFCIEELGLMDASDELMEWHIKVEDSEEPPLANHRRDSYTSFTSEPLDPKFGLDSPATLLALEEEAVAKKICLRLDYEAVITAWSGQGSPWMDGYRPNFNPDDFWPDITGTCRFEDQKHQYEVRHVLFGGGDSGREARVSRYREKRRSRLFSKKIRYEVRKLNAEKRPRMKGRFVKRASLVGAQVSANTSSAPPVFSF